MKCESGIIQLAVATFATACVVDEECRDVVESFDGVGVFVSCTTCMLTDTGEECRVTGGTPSCYPLHQGYRGYCGAMRDA